MFLKLVTLALSVLPLIAGQDPALQIEGIEAHFKQAALVPALLPSFNPTAVLSLNFPGVGDVSPGQALTHDQTASQPTVKVTAANSSVTLDGNFTITMVDADIVGTDDSQVNRHWLENFVTVKDGTVSNTSAVAITPYAGPGPAAGTGPHRYVVIVYQQPDSFTPPAEFAPSTGVSKFSLTQYVSDSKLGSLLAASYFTVEEGTATVSLSATSAVVSSTLPPVVSASGTPGSNGNGSSPNTPEPGSAKGTTMPMALMFITGLILLAL